LDSKALVNHLIAFLSSNKALGKRRKMTTTAAAGTMHEFIYTHIREASENVYEHFIGYSYSFHRKVGAVELMTT
jgi:hypothetical protein